MESNNNIFQINWLFSGGAEGADELFGECARAVEHAVTHFSFEGHNTNCKNVVKLNAYQLHLADIYLQDANLYLKRKWPTRNAYVNCLLERNYYQIRDSESIYAISFFEKNGHIQGGTAWAVMMGILKGITNIYIFDQDQNNWFSFINFDRQTNFISWDLISKPPFPISRYTGIGSRSLSDNGKKAIKQLYNLS